MAILKQCAVHRPFNLGLYIIAFVDVEVFSALSIIEEPFIFSISFDLLFVLSCIFLY